MTSLFRHETIRFNRIWGGLLERSKKKVGYLLHVEERNGPMMVFKMHKLSVATVDYGSLLLWWQTIGLVGGGASNDDIVSMILDLHTRKCLVYCTSETWLVMWVSCLRLWQWSKQMHGFNLAEMQYSCPSLYRASLLAASMYCRVFKPVYFILCVLYMLCSTIDLIAIFIAKVFYKWVGQGLESLKLK